MPERIASERGHISTEPESEFEEPPGAGRDPEYRDETAHQDREAIFKAEIETFKDFYERMKPYQNGEQWALGTIEEASTSLREVFSEFRDTLDEADLADHEHIDQLLQALVDAAQSAKSENEFIRAISEHERMKPGEPLEEFYRYFADGMIAKQEEQHREE